MSTTGTQLSVVPRDGLRQRFSVVLPSAGGACRRCRPVHVARRVRRDGFAAGQAIILDRALKSMAFGVENRTGDRTQTTIRLALPAGTTWEARVNGRAVPVVANAGTDYPFRIVVPVAPAPLHVTLRRR